MSRSVWHTAVAAILTSASPAAGTGSGRSASSNLRGSVRTIVLDCVAIHGFPGRVLEDVASCDRTTRFERNHTRGQRLRCSIICASDHRRASSMSSNPAADRQSADEIMQRFVAERGDLFEEFLLFAREAPETVDLVRRTAGYVHFYENQTAEDQLLS